MINKKCKRCKHKCQQEDDCDVIQCNNVKLHKTRYATESEDIRNIKEDLESAYYYDNHVPKINV